MTTPLTETELANSLIDKLADLKYVVRDDVRDRAALEANKQGLFPSVTGEV